LPRVLDNPGGSAPPTVSGVRKLDLDWFMVHKVDKMPKKLDPTVY
jgi:hypothetical protein